jgi:hypothetical protein
MHCFNEIAFFGQHIDEQLAHLPIVIDNQDPGARSGV